MHQIELWALIPFALMLTSIAVLPLVAEHWWENNLHKLYVALGLAIPASIYLILNDMGSNLEHQMLFDIYRLSFCWVRYLLLQVEYISAEIYRPVR